MQQSFDAMKLALRVLEAVNERREPDSQDVAGLRALAPLIANLPLDELACEVMRLALERRAKVREAVRRGV